MTGYTFVVLILKLIVMKKIAILLVMLFAFSLTQASNHVVVKESNLANQQKTVAVQNGVMQASSVFNLMADETVSSHHTCKTKQPKADKKPKVKKEKQHKTEAERKADHEQKEKARKAEHPKNHNGNHHHHKKENK